MTKDRRSCGPDGGTRWTPRRSAAQTAAGYRRFLPMAKRSPSPPSETARFGLCPYRAVYHEPSQRERRRAARDGIPMVIGSITVRCSPD